jgi:hypothetical protein
MNANGVEEFTGPTDPVGMLADDVELATGEAWGGLRRDVNGDRADGPGRDGEVKGELVFSRTATGEHVPNAMKWKGGVVGKDGDSDGGIVGGLASGKGNGDGDWRMRAEEPDGGGGKEAGGSEEEKRVLVFHGPRAGLGRQGQSKPDRGAKKGIPRLFRLGSLSRLK